MAHSEFKDKLLQKINASLSNNFSDNYDYHRFGINPPEKGIKAFLRKKFIFPNYIAAWQHKEHINKLFDNLIYLQGLSQLYDNLSNDSSKNLLIDIIASRILGHKFVKLHVNNSQYWEAFAKADACIIDKNASIKTAFHDWSIYNYNLNPIGYDLNLYFISSGVVANFILEQYAYKNESVNISAKQGDIVIDAGACWGDSSLYFATKVKETGMVYSFEFIPENIKIYNKNLALNKEIASHIKLIPNPLWDADDLQIYFTDKGPSSLVSFNETENYTGTAKTITIDAWAQQHHVQKIDFIKMDIEGAELKALQGAQNTIKTHKPTLAIAIYHSMNDFVSIPQWILNLNLGYKLYLGHYTIHSEETILFATVN